MLNNYFLLLSLKCCLSDRHCKDITISDLFQRFSPKFLRVVATGQAIYDKTRKMPRFLSHQHGLLAGPKPSLAYATRCAQGRQDRRRHRCDDLHNPLKSLFLRHNRLIDLMVLKIWVRNFVSPQRHGVTEFYLNLCTEFSVSLSLCGFTIPLINRPRPA